jgi:hypothetical protein
MKAKIDAMYVDGRTTIMADYELEEIIGELAPYLLNK